MLKRTIIIISMLILMVGCGNTSQSNNSALNNNQKKMDLTYEYRYLDDNRYHIVFYGTSSYDCPIDLRNLHIVVKDSDGNITDESDCVYMSSKTIEPNCEFLGTYLDYDNEKEPSIIEVSYDVEVYENFDCYMDFFEIKETPDYENNKIELSCTNNSAETKSIHIGYLLYKDDKLIYDNEGHLALDLEAGKKGTNIIEHYDDFDDYKIFYSIY